MRSLLGQGTFGQVVECTRTGPEGLTEQVAVKVIKNQTAYFNQVRRPLHTAHVWFCVQRILQSCQADVIGGELTDPTILHVIMFVD